MASSVNKSLEEDFFEEKLKKDLEDKIENIR